MHSPSALSSVPVPARSTWSSSGEILVIEDDESVLSVACAMLRSFGLTPVPAEDGERGLAIFQENPSRFVMVMLDSFMPRMNGEQTLSRLRALNERVRVLLMSGYGESDGLAKFTADGSLGFLPKPFSRTDLERKLRAVLA